MAQMCDVRLWLIISVLSLSLFAGLDENIRRIKSITSLRNTPSTSTSLLHSSTAIDLKSQPIKSLTSTIVDSSSEGTDFTGHQLSIGPTSTSNNQSDGDHRTVLARHLLQSTLKRISIRWMRETPV
jgi:hypothetical protein